MIMTREIMTNDICDVVLVESFVLVNLCNALMSGYVFVSLIHDYGMN